MRNRLLLADDSLTIQKVVELVLVHENFDIKAVNDGEAALSFMESFVPDIVLADIEMPKLNGYQLCERLKKNTAFAHIPVVLLAGAFEPFDEEYARTVGADDFIIKPFESQELISKVKALLINVSPVEETAVEEEKWEEPQDTYSEPVTMAEEEKEWGEETVSVQVSAPGVDTDDEFESKMALMADVRNFDKELEDALQIEAPPVSHGTASVSLQLPPQEDIARIVRNAVEERVSQAMENDVLPRISSEIRDAAVRAIGDLAPAIIEKTTRDVVAELLNSLRGEIHAVIGRVVPEVTEAIIRKEIDKITSEL